MKFLTPIFAFIACILLAGCEDQEYNETGAVPPSEIDEFAADTEAAGDTDAVIILDETENQPEMTGEAEEETYRAAKPEVSEPADQAGAADDQATAQQGDDADTQAKKDASMESAQPTPEPGTTSDQPDNQAGTDSAEADQADVVDEIE